MRATENAAAEAPKTGEAAAPVEGQDRGEFGRWDSGDAAAAGAGGPSAHHGAQEGALLALHLGKAGHRGHRVLQARQLLQHLGLPVAQHLEARGQELRDHRLRLRGVAAHEVGQHVDRQDVLATRLVLGDDLQQILPGQIVARAQIDDANLAPLADHAGDLVQGHVVAGFGVVEPAAGIALDQQGPVGGLVGIGGHLGLRLLRLQHDDRGRLRLQRKKRAPRGTRASRSRPVRGGRAVRGESDPDADLYRP